MRNRIHENRNDHEITLKVRSRKATLDSSCCSKCSIKNEPGDVRFAIKVGKFA